MAELRGVDVLQNEIEKSKDKLRGYNENIRKLTGRDPTRPGVRRLLSGDRLGEEDGFQNRISRGRGRLFGLARRSIMEDTGPPSKRRAVGGAFSRLGPAPMRRRDREDSPYEEELPHKLSVQSSVVTTSRDAKNRDEIMQEQTKDKEGMQRNRRMFGLLLGTLNKFKTESKTLETKDVRRKKIEEKLEEKAEKERKKFKQETKLLMEEMHLEQSKISRLEQKMEMVQEHADREAEMMKLKNFIATKAKPRIFWKPVQMTTATENKMKDSKKFVDDLLQEGKDRLDKEILELMERENKREERIKMRLREDGLLGNEEEEDAEGDTISREGSGRVVVESRDSNSSKSVTDRLGRKVGDEEEEEEEEEEGELVTPEESRRKPRRTVVLDTEEKEMSEPEEGKEKENYQMDTEEKDVEEESQPEENISNRRTVSLDNGKDVDKDDEVVNRHAGKIQRQSSDGADRSNSVNERERRKSGEKRESGKDRSRHRESKSNRRANTDERLTEPSEEKDKQHRTRERVRDRSTERERRKHRHGDGRRDSRERSRRESRDERRDHKKGKRQTRTNSDSDENSRAVSIKKEREEEDAGKTRRKASKSSGSDDDDDNGGDDVVVKKEVEAPRRSSEGQSRGDGAGDAASPVKLDGDGDIDEALDTEENGAALES